MFNLEKIRAAKARLKFKDFVGYSKPDYEFNWHHEALCEKLEAFAKGKIKRLMVFMPPRHGKSELASRRFPAWLFGINPNAKVISTSYAAELSSTFNRDVQRIIDSKSYYEVFPDTTLSHSHITNSNKAKWIRNNDSFEIVNQTGFYRCAGVGGAITGLGGDFLIIDDPYKNYEEAKSPTIRRKVWEWYTSTLYTRQEKDAGILLCQTRWHEDDLAGLLLEQQKKGGEFADQWEVIEFPAILEKENSNDPRKVNEVLWPNKYDYHWMQVTKHTIGSFQFSALYQQTPTPDQGIVIKASWIKYYDALPDYFEEIIQSWDLSFGSISETASFVVGSVYGKRGSAIYLIDQVRGQWDFTETIAQFRILNKKHPKAFRKLVERKANGQAVIDQLKNEIQGLIPIDPEGSKDSRLTSCQPLYEAGNILYPHELIAPWINDHVDEIVAFPNAKHNDRVDAESQAINFFKSTGVGKWTPAMQPESSGFGIEKMNW